MKKRTTIMDLWPFEEHHSCQRDGNGTVCYRDYRGELHRLDGPAQIFPDSTECYYFHGKLHRRGGPAIISQSGYRAWVVEGRKHRLDGPAVESPGRDDEYWIKGQRFTVEAFWRRVAELETAGVFL